LTVQGVTDPGDEGADGSASPVLGRVPSPPPAQTQPQVALHSCSHDPPCPPADGPARDAARVVIRHCVQGWSLLCNGVIYFDDTGEILPTGRTVEPRRCPPRPERVFAQAQSIPAPRSH
jgi:hypothetical protein